MSVNQTDNLPSDFEIDPNERAKLVARFSKRNNTDLVDLEEIRSRFTKRDDLEIKPEALQAVETGDWTDLANRYGAYIFLEGLTLGWSDEVILGAQAAAISASSDESYDEVFARLNDEYKQNINRYQQQNPKAATALEVGGAVISPVGKLAAGVKGLSILGKTSLTGLTLRGAFEGGVQALGQTDSDTFSQAASRTLEGMSVGGAFGLAGGALGGFFKRRIKEDVDTPEGFKPLTLAASRLDPAEDTIQSFYRDIVSPSFGAKGIVRGQEANIVVAREAQRDAAKKTFDEFEEVAKKEIADQKTKMDRAILESTAKFNKDKDSVIAKQLEDRALVQGKYKDLEGSEGKIMRDASKQIQQVIDDTEDLFRATAVQASFPQATSKNMRELILKQDTPNGMLRELKKQWSSNGFKSIKKGSYKFNADDFLKRVVEKTSDDASVSLLLSKGSTKTDVLDLVNSAAGRTTVRSKKIKGEDFASLRSRFGSIASNFAGGTGEDAIKYKLYTTVQREFDNYMFEQLDENSIIKKQFDLDRQAYKPFVVLEDAIRQKSKKTGENGRFNLDGWLASSAKNNIKEVGEGGGPLRLEAERSAALIRNADKTITDKAKKYGASLAKIREQKLNALTIQKNTEISQLKNELAVLKDSLRNNPMNAGKIAANNAKKETLQKEVDKLNEALDELNIARTTDQPTWFQLFAATGVLGSLGAAFGGVGGSLPGAAAGIALGRGLASPTAQRAIAGQNVVQQAAQALGRRNIPVANVPLSSLALGAVPASGRATVGLLTGTPLQQ